MSIYNSISPLPSNLSGLLIGIVNEKTDFASTYTGDSIDQSNVPAKYISAIEHLALSHVLTLISIQDLGVSEVRVGEMSTRNDNLIASAKMFEEDGMMKLKILSKGIKFFKARG